MAVALGAVPLLLDVISSRIIIPDRKPRPLPSTSTSPTDVVLNLPKRDPHPHPHHHHHHHHHVANTYASIAANSSSESFEKVNRKSDRVIARGMSNSESNDVDFDFDEGEDEVNGSDEDDESRIIWEKTMRKRMKEIEEMKELEKKAEELQSRMEADGDDNGGGDETEEEKRIRVRKELEKVAKEQAERRASANLMFEVGQKAYGRGMYGRSIEFFEGALTIIPKPTLFGGEIQIWLAMAYEANNRHADCITLYKQLEQKHPCVTIRRQAAELRYILQAPKLKISQEEMVTIPLIGSSYDSYAGTWTDKYKDKDERLSGSTTNQLPSSKDYVGDFMVWKPPVELEKNRAFWVTVTLWLGLVGAAVFLQR